jgi:diguanylate cyclase (GGDEF)-like protein
MKLAAPIITAAVATVVLTNVAMVVVAGGQDVGAVERIQRIWPLAFASACSVVLIMSVLYGALRDTIRDLEQREEQARYLAAHDALTGLPNRLLLNSHLEAALARLKRGAAEVALLTIDLDGFKQVNDTHGHPAGDEVLRQVATRLKQVTRDTDTVARTGGDEFVVLLAGSGEAVDLEALGARFLSAIRQPIDLGATQIRISASIGAIRAGEPGISSSELARKSDVALYRAKSEGRDRMQLFPAGNWDVLAAA